MSASRAPRGLQALFAGVLGGASAGAIVGIVEAGIVIANAGPGSDYWVGPFALLAYGSCGAVLGSCCWLIAALFRMVADSFGRAAAVVFLILGSVVGRYQLVQRIFHEQLDTWTLHGLVVHASLFSVVSLMGLLLFWMGKRIESTPRGLSWTVLIFGVSVSAASVAATITDLRRTLPSTSPVQEVGVGARPSLILIIADTLRADALGAFSAVDRATPAIDRFAAESVRFTNAYSNSTWTRPSVATILTSLYPSQHQAVHKLDALPGEVLTLAEVLQGQGYRTTGIVSNINLAPIFNFAQGFDEFTYLPPEFYFGASDSAARLAIYKVLRVVRERCWPDRLYVGHYYQDAEVVNREVFEWLSAKPAQPSFLMIHYMDPHDPYFEMPYNGQGFARVANPNPPATMGDTLRSMYAQDVTYLDTHLGVLFDRLRQLGWFDSSVIALLSDHGEEFHEHGGWWHGTTLYEEQMHIPLLIKRAHEAQAGRVERRVVTTLDVAPTLLGALGADVPTEFRGRDQLTAVSLGDVGVFAEDDFEGNVLASIRIGDWKLVSANTGNPRGLDVVELYNLAVDPAERSNVAEHESARVHAMMKKLEQARTTGSVPDS